MSGGQLSTTKGRLTDAFSDEINENRYVSSTNAAEHERLQESDETLRGPVGLAGDVD